MIVMITSYNRPAMLKKAVKAWQKAGAEVHVFDDGSDFEPLEGVAWHAFRHGGKAGFWRLWNAMLKEARARADHDLIVFSPDDFQEPQVERIIEAHKRFNKYAYAHNLVNDGRLQCWNSYMPQVIDSELMAVGFVDCGFFCNQKTIDALGAYMPDTSEWAARHSSSGVGHNLSTRMLKRSVLMLMPTRSICKHGNHESKMHPEERKKNPLPSK